MLFFFYRLVSFVSATEALKMTFNEDAFGLSMGQDHESK